MAKSEANPCGAYTNMRWILDRQRDLLRNLFAQTLDAQSAVKNIGRVHGAHRRPALHHGARLHLCRLVEPAETPMRIHDPAEVDAQRSTSRNSKSRNIARLLPRIDRSGAR
jgi:hypothetical protein